MIIYIVKLLPSKFMFMHITNYFILTRRCDKPSLSEDDSIIKNHQE